MRWNFAGIARFPYKYGEDRFFHSDIHEGRCEVTQSGTMLTITLHRPPGEVIRFGCDLALGGMVVQATYDQKTAEAYEHATGKYQWTMREGHAVPVQFDTDYEGASIKSGSYMHNAARTVFTGFHIGPVPPGSLSVASLDIPNGTPVHDAVRKQEFPYSLKAWEEKVGWPATPPAGTQAAGSIHMEVQHEPTTTP
jgi:hypothetical protein